MTLKEKVILRLQELNINPDSVKIRYFSKSPYQARHYKAEYVNEEVWLYPKGKDIPSGLLITSKDFENKEYTTNLLEMELK